MQFPHFAHLRASLLLHATMMTSVGNVISLRVPRRRSRHHAPTDVCSSAAAWGRGKRRDFWKMPLRVFSSGRTYTHARTCVPMGSAVRAAACPSAAQDLQALCGVHGIAFCACVPCATTAYCPAAHHKKIFWWWNSGDVTALRPIAGKGRLGRTHRAYIVAHGPGRVTSLPNPSQSA